MTPTITPATRLIALLGDPVHHSLSPRFQNAAIEAARLDAVYLALRCGPEEVIGLLVGIARAGGAGNVTVPHKELAATAVERPTEAVRLTGACNTFWCEEGIVFGDNTDVAGFSAAARSLLGATPRGARVLLIGAGGAARAVVCALVQDGADEVVIVNRSRARAAELVRRFSDGATRLVAGGDSPESQDGESFDLVVNATAVGLHPGDPLPLGRDMAVGVGAALDLVYRPEMTAWVQYLRARGTPAADGLEMLLQQGAVAFEKWWGRQAPIDAMRAALPAR